MKTKTQTVRLNMSIKSLIAERDEVLEKADKLGKWLGRHWWDSQGNVYETKLMLLDKRRELLCDYARVLEQLVDVERTLNETPTLTDVLN